LIVFIRLDGCELTALFGSTLGFSWIRHAKLPRTQLVPQNCINFVKPPAPNGTRPFYRIDAKFQLPANASPRTCAVTRRGSQGWLGFALPHGL